jgi:hypothetical protein
MSVRKFVPPKVVALFAAPVPDEEFEPAPAAEPVLPVEPVPVLPAAFVPLTTMMCS